MNYLSLFLWSLIGLLIATTVHELTRAVVSTALGDQVPKSQGRLSPNPLKHFEPIGFFILFYSGVFGWGKPVETRANLYKNRKQDTLMVAVMPTLMNLMTGVLFAMLSHVLPYQAQLDIILYYVVYYNIALAIGNLIPVSPMDGAKVLAVLLPANKYYAYLQREKMIQAFFLFLLFLGVFGPLRTGINFLVLALMG